MLLHTPSHLTHGCLGIAHQYSNNYEEATKHFSIAYDLVDSPGYEVRQHLAHLLNQRLVHLLVDHLLVQLRVHLHLVKQHLVHLLLVYQLLVHVLVDFFFSINILLFFFL